MALVRCPSCGRVADGKMCFACGYEWPEGAAAPPPPSSPPASSPPAPASPSPSQSFKIASPASFPTAAVVARTPTPPPVAAPETLPPDEIDLDVDFEERRASGTFTPPTAPVFGSAPAFPSPSGSFGSPPPAFPSPSGSFGGAPGGFGSPPPAFPSPSGAFGGAPPPAFGTSPPPAFPALSTASQSGAFAAPPLAPAPPSTLPPVADPWGAPAAPAAPAVRPPSMSYAPPAAPQPSWGSNPTVQVPASVASSLLQGLAPAAPAALSGLFDGLNQPPERPAPPVVTPPPMPSDEGEINFTLEPGSGVEPSPFADVVDSVDVDLDRVASSRSLPIDFAEDLVDEAPAAAPAPPAVSLTSGFAELDAGDLDAAIPMAATSTAFDPFAAAEPELPAPPPVPPLPPVPRAPTPVPAPIAVAPPEPVETPVVVDESSFADVEAGLADEVPLATNPAPFDPLDGEAAFDALGGLDDLGPVSLDDDASLEALAELDREIAAFEAESPPPAPEPVAASTSTAAPAVARGPTLSARVGTLAESLEEGGRIADAALLYEVQAVLAAAGR